MSVFVDRRLDEAFTRLGVGDVGGHGEGATTEFPDARRSLLDQFGPPAREHDVGAVLRQHLRRGPANAGAAAGHDRHSSIQQEHFARHDPSHASF